MIVEEISKIRRFINDFFKVFLFMGVSGVLLYWADPANAVVFQAMGIAIFMVGGTHLTRRILFNSIDLQAIARTAINEKNMPAALVFAAFMAFLIAVMMLSMQVFK